LTITETTATSGAVLGVVLVLALQQLGALPLSQVWAAVLAFLVAIALGAIIFGTVGALLERS